MTDGYRLKFVISFGIVAMAAAWVTIFVSIAVNPWFHVTGNALSDLGGGNPLLNGHPAPTDPWIYNYGLILTGLLIATFCAGAINLTNKKMEIAGISFFIISGLFLALIGIYHEGTYPHDFVSIWFFIIASISYIVIGISMLSGQLKKIGIILVIFIILSWVAYSLIPWQSVAEDEIFGVVVIDIAVFLHIYSFIKRSS